MSFDFVAYFAIPESLDSVSCSKCGLMSRNDHHAILAISIDTALSPTMAFVRSTTSVMFGSEANNIWHRLPHNVFLIL